MASFNDTGYGTVVVNEEIPKSRRVTAAGTLAGFDEIDLATSIARFAPEGQSTINEPVATLSLSNKQGSQKATADGPIPAGVIVYTADEGKISAAEVPGSFPRGISCEAADADESVISIIPFLTGIPVA